MSLGSQSLAHTSWNCKYHIVFAPKFRRNELYGLKRLEIGAILRKPCDFKQITIHEAEWVLEIPISRERVSLGYRRENADLSPKRLLGAFKRKSSSHAGQ